MIFVTVGSTTCPFERLLGAAGELADNEAVIAQSGATRVRPEHVTCVDYMASAVLQHHVSQARIVVTHAGVGSVALCLHNGIRPVVVPRLRRLGENIDDHQLEFARRLAQLGLVTTVEDVSCLGEAVAAPKHPPAATGLSRELADELLVYIARYAPLISEQSSPEMQCQVTVR